MGDPASIGFRRRQRVEVQLACKILNTMTSLRRPDSYRLT